MLKPLAAIVRVTAILLSLLACASVSIAAHRGGTALEDAGRAAPAARAIAAPSARPAPAPDDAACAPGVSKVAPAAPAPTAARREIAPTPDPRPASPAHRDRGRTTSSSARVQRPMTHRGKGQVHGAPATPGMGLLLRMSTGGGREISWVDDIVPHVPAGPRCGRSPPRGSPLSNSAPASPPRVLALAISTRALRPSTAADATHLETRPDVTTRHASVACECAVARACVTRATVTGRESAHDPEPVDGSRAAFAMGSTACSFTPFGGRFA